MRFYEFADPDDLQVMDENLSMVGKGDALAASGRIVKAKPQGHPAAPESAKIKYAVRIPGGVEIVTPD